MNGSKSDKAPSQQEIAQKALKTKQDNAPAEVNYPTGETADHGMERIEHTDQAPSGAFDDVEDKPARERSRERR